MTPVTLVPVDATDEDVRLAYAVIVNLLCRDWPAVATNMAARIEQALDHADAERADRRRLSEAVAVLYERLEHHEPETED